MKKNFATIIFGLVGGVLFLIFFSFIYAFESPGQSPPIGSGAFSGQTDKLLVNKLTIVSSTKLILKNSKLGIGTSSPVSLFHLKNNSTLTVPFIIETSSPVLYLSTSSNLGLLTSNPLSTLSVNGNVSIGYATSAPDYGLIVFGKVGIGTSTPLTSLEVANRNDVILAGGRYGINIEGLIGDKTLNPRTDKIYQYFHPNGAGRIIYLATTTAQQGDRFVIKNIADYRSSARLQINVGSSIIDYIYAAATREYIFDGNTWTGGVGTQIVGEYNLSIGYDAEAYNYGTAIGYQSRARNYGVAVGNTAQGFDYGIGIGYNARGYDRGVAIGYNSKGHWKGVSIGYESRSYGYGVSLGYYAGYNLSSSPVNLHNVLIGAYSGYQLTRGIGNIILGYQSGYDKTTSPTTGSYNILIGYQAGTPANDTSNFLNIGNLIFATGINTATGSNISNGKVGIRTLSPTALLHLKGQTGYDQLRLETSYTPTSTADPNGNIGDITWDDNYLYIKTNVGWIRFDLETF